MEPVSVAQCMNEPPDGHLGLHAFATNTPHVFATPFGGNAVSQSSSGDILVFAQDQLHQVLADCLPEQRRNGVTYLYVLLCL